MASKRDVDGSRPCGLYRTILPLPGHADAVAAGRLVYFHNHSNRGPPIVLLPTSNTHNTWTFDETGHVVEDEAFIEALERLEPEGLYRVREHFHPDGSRVVATGALVQLGYNRRAEPILFFPRPVEGENALMFPSQGMGIPPALYALLEPLDLRGPHELSRPH
jgi:hypothetical protein